MANNKKEEKETDWVSISGTVLRALGDILTTIGGPKK